MKVYSMSENEEYIACTRALEELLIYDCTKKMDIYNTRDNIMINEINNSIIIDRLECAKNKLIEIISDKGEKNKEYIIYCLLDRLVPSKYAKLLSIVWCSLSNQKFKQFVKSISKWLILYKDNEKILTDTLKEMAKNNENEKYKLLSNEIGANTNFIIEQKIS